MTASIARMLDGKTHADTARMPLQMIAEPAGDCSLGRFIRRFKQVSGVTPGEYRRNQQ